MDSTSTISATLFEHYIPTLHVRAPVSCCGIFTQKKKIMSKNIFHSSTRKNNTKPVNLAPMTAVDAALALERLPIAEAATAVGKLEHPRAAEVLDLSQPDLAVAILRELPAAPTIIAQLSPDSREQFEQLMQWPAESAASRMTPRFLTVEATSSVGDAMHRLRDFLEQAETIAYVYVTEQGKFHGVVSFRDLALAESEMSVAELTNTDFVSVDPYADQEEAAQLLSSYRLVAIPVVENGTVIGIITVDDVADIIEEEGTEDAEKQGASTPLGVPYLKATPWMLWRKRILWILVLFVAESYTGTVLRAFEDQLESVIALAFFIPLLIGTGGNTGTQITTTLVRAMAVGEVTMKDIWRVLRKEISTGVLIGACMAAAGIIRASILGVGFEISLVVALTVAAIVIWSSIVASILPMVLQKFKKDPAVISGPFITTLVDGTGLIIYFEIAKLILF